MAQKAVIAGGRGFLGTALAGRLLREGWEAVVLTRRPGAAGPVREVAWDGRTIGNWAEELDGAGAVVNLTGRSVNCVPNEENRRQILESRVDSVRVLGEAIGRSRRPPAVWVQSSSLALYGNTGDRVCDEQAPVAEDFPAQVCRRWEEALVAAAVPDTRKVALRIGLVLGPGGGALGPLVRLTRWFLGGTVGSGRQYLSWLHTADMTEIFWQAITRGELQGAYNACAPHPETNRVFMAELRRAVGRPWSPPAPEWAVRLGARYLLQTDAELALTGRRCIPSRLEQQGFKFRFPHLRPALEDIARQGF